MPSLAWLGAVPNCRVSTTFTAIPAAALASPLAPSYISYVIIKRMDFLVHPRYSVHQSQAKGNDTRRADEHVSRFEVRLDGEDAGLVVVDRAMRLADTKVLYV